MKEQKELKTLEERRQLTEATQEKRKAMLAESPILNKKSKFMEREGDPCPCNEGALVQRFRNPLPEPVDSLTPAAAPITSISIPAVGKLAAHNHE